MHLLYIEDTYTFPEADPADLDRAFEAVTEQYATLAEQIIDLAADPGKRQLTFTGTVKRADGEWPRWYAWAMELMDKFASSLMWEADMPRTVVDRRTQMRAQDGSFDARAELTFTVPAS